MVTRRPYVCMYVCMCVYVCLRTPSGSVFRFQTPSGSVCRFQTHSGFVCRFQTPLVTGAENLYMQIERVLFPGIPDAMEVGERWQQPHHSVDPKSCVAVRPLGRSVGPCKSMGFYVF